jgi:hypothetical protein
MKKYLFSFVMMVMGGALVTSCISDDDNKGSSSSKISVTSGLYVVNNGTWGQNNGSLTYFDYASLQAQQLLSGANGLGDTPNDAYTKGDTIFVVGSTENTIFVVNKKDFSIIKRISTTEGLGEAEGNTPRHITGYGNNIYFTTYGGYVGIIDAKSLAVSQIKYQVGSAPEGLTVGGTANEPVLYVANSDYGYGNASISKINLNSGTVEEIKNENIQNPQEIVALGNELYILDWGHYDENWNQIGAGLYYYYNGNITRLVDDATGMGVGMVYVNNQVVGYLLATFSAPYGSTSAPTYNLYDTYQRLKHTLNLSGDSGFEIVSPAAISVDPVRGYIAIASRSLDPDTGYASYTLPGFVNMYTSNGEYVKDTHFQTGVEPHMIGFTFSTQTIAN